MTEMRAFYHRKLNEYYVGNSLTSAYVNFRLKYPKLPGMKPSDFEIKSLKANFDV